MIAVAVTAIGVERDDDLRPHAADLPYQAARCFCWVGLRQAAVAVVEEAQILDADDAARLAQLLFAHLPQRLWCRQCGVANLPLLTPRGTDQRRLGAVVAVLAKDPGGAKRLIVGMREGR